MEKPWFPPIYKFMPRKYANGFLKRGLIKIGTSTEYRVADGYDDGRSDVYELRSIWNPGGKIIEVDSSHPFIKFLSRPEKPLLQGARK